MDNEQKIHQIEVPTSFILNLGHEYLLTYPDKQGRIVLPSKQRKQLGMDVNKPVGIYPLTRGFYIHSIPLSCCVCNKTTIYDSQMIVCNKGTGEERYVCKQCHIELMGMSEDDYVRVVMP